MLIHTLWWWSDITAPLMTILQLVAASIYLLFDLFQVQVVSANGAKRYVCNVQCIRHWFELSMHDGNYKIWNGLRLADGLDEFRMARPDTAWIKNRHYYNCTHLPKQFVCLLNYYHIRFRTDKSNYLATDNHWSAMSVPIRKSKLNNVVSGTSFSPRTY